MPEEKGRPQINSSMRAMQETKVEVSKELSATIRSRGVEEHLGRECLKSGQHDVGSCLLQSLFEDSSRTPISVVQPSILF